MESSAGHTMKCICRGSSSCIPGENSALSGTGPTACAFHNTYKALLKGNVQQDIKKSSLTIKSIMAPQVTQNSLLLIDCTYCFSNGVLRNIADPRGDKRKKWYGEVSNNCTLQMSLQKKLENLSKKDKKDVKILTYFIKLVCTIISSC